MTDHDVAIAHLVLRDAENPDHAADLRWHWARYFDNMVGSTHAGDCTGASNTCLRCVADETLRMVPIYRLLFGLSHD